jgi:hypothetical protein
MHRLCDSLLVVLALVLVTLVGEARAAFCGAINSADCGVADRRHARRA